MTGDPHGHERRGRLRIGAHHSKAQCFELFREGDVHILGVSSPASARAAASRFANALEPTRNPVQMKGECMRHIEERRAVDAPIAIKTHSTRCEFQR
jgi:hypothetical protein